MQAEVFSGMPNELKTIEIDVQRSCAYAAEYEDKVQKAVCALAEVLYQIDIAMKATMVHEDGNGGVIKSKSSGGESVSYDVSNNLIYVVLKDEAAQKKLKYNTVAKYLRGTGLLYAGVE